MKSEPVNHILKAKKIYFTFFRHRPRHLQTPTSKIFIALAELTLKNHLYIINCKYNLVAIFGFFLDG